MMSTLLPCSQLGRMQPASVSAAAEPQGEGPNVPVSLRNQALIAVALGGAHSVKRFAGELLACVRHFSGGDGPGYENQS
jgi:hypothetical protein